MPIERSNLPILVAGVGPLPPEKPDRLYAPGLRLWGMARELARAGHPVRLVAAAFGQADRMTLTVYDVAPERDHPRLSDPRPIQADTDAVGAAIAGQAAEFHPAATVSTTDVMNHAVAAAGLTTPAWMDYFGDPLAEAQLLAVRGGSDEGLARQWSLVAPALARGDRFSGCSRDQAAAITAQLGVAGRLNQFTAFEPLVEVLQPWFEPIPIDIDSPSPLREKLPPDAFVIVQTGGFNTWLDVETLFAALERAMAADPRIHFAATGGAIAGHYAGGFEWFAGQVEKSAHQDRYRLLGWIPVGQVPRVIHEADLAMNIDLACAEGRFGTRNRILDWLGAAIPTISTPGCELAETLGLAKLVHLIPHQDPEAAAKAILAHAADPKPGRECAAEAAAYLRKAYDPAICLKPLIEWAAEPKSASDLQMYAHGREYAHVGAPSVLLAEARDAAKTRREAIEKARRLAQLERNWAAIMGSRWVKLAFKLRGRKGLDDPGES